MDPFTTVLVFRHGERILAMVIAGLSLYLGYRLFREVRYEATGEGGFRLPGGASIFVSKVGPGVFFAIFGTAVLIHSFRNPVEVETPGWIIRGFTEETTSLSSSGRGEPLLAPEEMRRHLMFLRETVPSSLREGLSADDSNDVDSGLRELKLLVMRLGWDEDSWGRYGSFVTWVRRGERGPVPRDLEEAARIYRGVTP